MVFSVTICHEVLLLLSSPAKLLNFFPNIFFSISKPYLTDNTISRFIQKNTSIFFFYIVKSPLNFGGWMSNLAIVSLDLVAQTVVSPSSDPTLIPIVGEQWKRVGLLKGGMNRDTYKLKFFFHLLITYQGHTH